jgi:hypothetical protein
MNKYIKLAIGASLGALAGFGYYYFIGCNMGGGCPLTSNWWVTTVYGSFMGLIIGLPSKKKAIK